MNTDHSYGAGTIKRVRRTSEQIEQLDLQIVEALNEDHPQSVRHVFYRMTDPRLPEPVEKSDNGYRTVQRRLLLLRDNGRVPFNWITDASRRGYHVDTFRNEADFLRRMKSLYRADLWKDAAIHGEVWVESRSLAGVILNDCQELAVSLYPAGGFTSKTLAYEASDSLNRMELGSRPVVVFYIGDLDPAGVLIDVDIERKLRQHLDPRINLTFQRIGITPEQVRQFDLPTKARKAGDKRSLHITQTVEAESLPAAIMRGILRQHIEALLPAHALKVAKAEEHSAKQYFERVAEIIEGDSP